MRIPRKSGFTLIELLVVISIIALLISILLPALSSARAVSRQILCQSQLRQIATWGVTYSVDNNDILPTHGDGGDAAAWNNITTTFWHYKAEDDGLYMGWGTVGPSPMHCPEATTQINPFRDNPRGITYSINSWIGGQRYRWNLVDEAPKPTSALLNSEAFWFADGDVSPAGAGAWDFQPILTIYPNNDPISSTYKPWSFISPTDPNVQGHPNHSAGFVYGDVHTSTMSNDDWIATTAQERADLVAYPF